MRRDLLYLQYGDEWAKHDKHAGRFWAVANQADKDELCVLMALADDC